MADITKSTVSSSSGGGSIVSKSDTASKAGSDLVTGSELPYGAYCCTGAGAGEPAA